MTRKVDERKILKEHLKKFIAEELKGEIFNESENEIRFIHPDKELRQKYNSIIDDQIKSDFISKFIDYMIKNHLQISPVYTITILTDNPDNLVIVIGF